VACGEPRGSRRGVEPMVGVRACGGVEKPAGVGW